MLLASLVSLLTEKSPSKDPELKADKACPRDADPPLENVEPTLLHPKLVDIELPSLVNDAADTLLLIKHTPFTELTDPNATEAQTDSVEPSKKFPKALEVDPSIVDPRTFNNEPNDTDSVEDKELPTQKILS